MVRFKIVEIQNGKHFAGQCNHGRDFHPLADHRTKLRNFTKGEIHEFSLHSMFDQTLSNFTVCLMISQKLRTKVAQTSQHVAVNSR